MSWEADVIAFAQKDVDARYAEDPPKSNLTKFGKWWGADGNPWCAMAVSFWFHHSGHPLPALQSKRGFAGCILGWRAAKKLKRTVTFDKARPGDIFVHDAGGGKGHTGIVKKVNRDANGEVVSLVTIEGNSNRAGSRTGGECVNGLRERSYVNLGLIRPFDSTPIPAPTPPSVVATPVASVASVDQFDEAAAELRRAFSLANDAAAKLQKLLSAIKKG